MPILTKEVGDTGNLITHSPKTSYLLNLYKTRSKLGVPVLEMIKILVLTGNSLSTKYLDSQNVMQMGKQKRERENEFFLKTRC